MEATGARLVRYKDKDAAFSIWAVGDVHLGNIGCAKGVLRDDIGRIRHDPYSLWSLLGDYCDWIGPGDKRFDPQCVDETITVRDMARLGRLLAERAVEWFQPIADKCMGCGYGNHEGYYFSQNACADLHNFVCEGLGAANLMYSGFYDIYFEHCPRQKAKVEIIKNASAKDTMLQHQVRLRIYQHHGSGAAATAGGRINRLTAFINMLTGVDLVMIGHLHEELAKKLVRLGVDDTCREVRQTLCMGLITGSYLRGHTSGCTMYSESKGYPPNALGATRAMYYPARRRLENILAADNVGVTF